MKDMAHPDEPHRTTFAELCVAIAGGVAAAVVGWLAIVTIIAIWGGQ